MPRSFRSSKPSPTAPRSSRTSTTSRWSGAVANSKCGTLGPTWPFIISTCGCIRWWNFGPGTVPTRNSAIAAVLLGTTPNGILLMRIDAKPYDDISCETNYRRSLRFGGCREKSSGCPNALWLWLPDMLHAFRKCRPVSNTAGFSRAVMVDGCLGLFIVTPGAARGRALLR